MKIFFLVIALAGSLVSYAQDDLVSYTSTAEKTQLHKDSPKTYKDYFRLALLSSLTESEATTYNKMVDDFVAGLNWQPSTRPDKKLKPIFEAVHFRFLKKYELNASFDQLFTSGTYQCVNASLLYAYILESLQIPYQIKELPTHVNVVAYPESYNIMIETTDPTKGYFVPSEKGKENYVNGLVKSKFLEESYVKKVGIEKAFNEFFYGKTNISLAEAVGLMYYNSVIRESENKSYKTAYSNSYKANFLYPAKKHEFMKISMLSELVDEQKIDNESDWAPLVALANLDHNQNTSNHLLYKFNEYLDRFVFKASKKIKADSVYQYLQKNLTDSTLKSNIKGHYLQEISRFLYISSKMEEGRPYFEQAVSFNPDNALTKNMLIEYIGRRSLTPIATVQNLKKLDDWVARFPTLKAESRIKTMYLLHYIDLGNKAGNAEQEANVLKYYNLLAKGLKENAEIENLPEEEMAELMMGAMAYYMMKKQKTKAMEALDLGIKYCPNSKSVKEVARNKSKLLNANFDNLK
jgi:hypothetical protein